MNEISLFLFALRVLFIYLFIIITVSTNPMCGSDNMCVVLVNFF